MSEAREARFFPHAQRTVESLAIRGDRDDILYRRHAAPRQRAARAFARVANRALFPAHALVRALSLARAFA